MWGDDSYSYRGAYDRNQEKRDKVESLLKIIRSHPAWYAYPEGTKFKLEVEKAANELEELRKSCSHEWKVEILVQLPKKICTICKAEDRSYNHLKND